MGVAVGGAAGFLTGIVLAPEKGQMFRRRLVYRLEHLAEKVTAYVDQVVSPQQVSEARRSGDQVVAEAQQRAKSIREDIDALLGEIRRNAPDEQEATRSAERPAR